MIPYTIFTLDNGLRVAHTFDPMSAMAVVDVLYDTGARDERPDSTGIAHLFEHLMFGGSANVSEFDTQLEMAGGSSNAYTSNDFTEFHAVLPAQNAETAFWLESDRMLAPDLTEKGLKVQQSVVIEEFKQTCLNQPYGRVMHALRPLLYPRHPYRWPVIGVDPSHIEAVTLDDAKQWHLDHYAPNKAILTVAGHVTLEQTKEWAQKWFGDIPRRDTAPRNLIDDPWPTRPQRVTIYDNVPQTTITVAWRMHPYGHKGYFAADAITDILAAGKSSRMYQRLLMGTDLFTIAQASILGSEHSGLLVAVGYLTREDEESLQQAERLLIEECMKIATPGDVTPYELDLTKNRYEATFAFENISLLNRAQNLALAVMHGEDINDNVPRYRSLTLEDIASTAKEIFIDHSYAMVVCRPMALKPGS